VTLAGESAPGGNLHHLLLVGPAGSGKSHLAALAAARLERLTPASGRPLVARLPEDPWGITSFPDLLLQACRALEGRDPVVEILPSTSRGKDLSPAEAARLAEERLREAAGKRPLVLILENADQVFAALGEEGQKAFRSFLQQDPFTAVVATSRRLFDAVTRRTAPFYGFFRVEHLEPLHSREALNLAGKIFRKLGVPPGETPASRPEAAAWVRAVHHVSSGNTRFCLLFALALARGETFEGAFFDALDRVLHLYLAELRDVSPQQKKILDHLARREGSVQVKEIARGCLATEQTVSSQLRELRNAGLVSVTLMGRNSYYELTPPLLRLCLNLRQGKAESIRLALHFLSHWFRPAKETDHRILESIQAGPGGGKWEKTAAALLEEHEKKGTLASLSAALVRSLAPLLSSHLGGGARRAWPEAWRKKGARHPETALALALMDAALGESPSQALLALPREYRELLEGLVPA